jgi:hypothetical protein
MAILRAGPWGSLTETHEDVPVDTTVELNIYPVNCAKTDWASGQAWAAFREVDEDFTDPFFRYGVLGLGDGIAAVTEDGGVRMTFCWQSTEEFTIDLNWDIYGLGLIAFIPSLSWVYNTIDGSGDSYSNTPANDGTITVTLPATTFGEFSWFVSAIVVDGGFAYVGASIS